MPEITSIRTRSEVPVLALPWRREVRKRLEAARAELRSAFGQPDERSNILEGRPPPGEFAAESVVRDLEFRRREALLERLGRVEDALERLRLGTYGRCNGCGQDIGWRRLAVDPATERCHACQEASETSLRTPSL